MKTKQEIVEMQMKQYIMQMKDLRDKLKILIKRIELPIYEYGFLKCNSIETYGLTYYELKS